MALLTGGTTTTSVLQGLRWTAMSSISDVAALAALIKAQANPAHQIWPGAFTKGGVLDCPERFAQLNLKPGDYVFVDSNGWPIPVSGESIAAGGTSWVHS